MRLLAKDPRQRPMCAEVEAVLADLTAGPAPAAVRISARAKVAMPRAAVPSVGRSGLASVPLDRTRRGRRRVARVIRYWPVAVIALVGVIVLAAAAWRAVPRETGDSPAALDPPSTPSLTTAAPPQTSSAAQSAKVVVPANQAPSPTAQPSSPAPPSDPIAALRLAVQQQVSTGNLNPDKASDLYSKVDAIAHAAVAGNAGDEAKNIKAFKDRLTALRTGGQLSVTGYDILSDAADAISATLP